MPVKSMQRAVDIFILTSMTSSRMPLVKAKSNKLSLKKYLQYLQVFKFSY